MPWLVDSKRFADTFGFPHRSVRNRKLSGGDRMKEIILDLGPINSVDDTAFDQAIERLAEWHEARVQQGWQERDAPDLMIKTVSDSAGQLRKAVIFQKQEWATAFLGFWNNLAEAS